MELVDYLRVLRRRWQVIAATVVLALVAAWVTTPAQATEPQIPVGTTYRATHTLLQAADAPNPPNLELTRLFATTGDIPRRAAARLGQPPEQGPALATRVAVAVDPKVGSLTVTVTGADGEEAAAIANAFATEIVESLRQTVQRDRDAEQAEATRLVQELGNRIALLQAQIVAREDEAPLLRAQRDAFLKNYTAAFSRLQAVSELGAPRSPLATLEEAVPVPIVASSAFTPPTSRLGRMGLAALLGLVLGAVLALLLERVDSRLRTREAVEDITTVPVVAEVPMLPRKARRDWTIHARTAPASAAAEAYRSLRSAIMLVPSRPAMSQAGSDPVGKTPQVLLVTSPLPADGKTTTVANLAVCLAESGRRVLVLDCDFRNPTLHRYLDVQPGRGISDLLAATSPADLGEVVRPTSVPGVRLVTSGNVTGHPAALLARAGGLLDAARQLADVVLVDAPPVLVANDATDLVPYVDAVVLVARSGRTTREHALRTTELLARLSVPIAGTVLVGASGPISGYAPRHGLLSLLGLRHRASGAEPPREWSAEPAATDQQRRSLHLAQGEEAHHPEALAPVSTGTMEGTAPQTGSAAVAEPPAGAPPPAPLLQPDLPKPVPAPAQPTRPPWEERSSTPEGTQR